MDLSPNNNLCKEVYAIRLFENGTENELDQAYNTLDAIVMEKKATERGYNAWYILQQDKLAKLIETKDWAKIRAEANHLLSIFPQDARGLEAIKQADSLMNEELEKDKANDTKKEEK